MIARSFRSLAWCAGVAATALACYMVNLQVASERVALEEVETQIVLAQRDIRLLQTEIGTRGRLAQLEKWNVKVLALSAPQANQFLDGSFQLATLMRSDKPVDPEAPIVLAAAQAPESKSPVMDSDGAAPAAAAAPELMHVASLKVDEPKPAATSTKAKKQEPLSAEPKKKAVEKTAKPSTAGASAEAKPAKQKVESAKTAEAKPKPKATGVSTAVKTKPKEVQAKQ